MTAQMKMLYILGIFVFVFVFVFVQAQMKTLYNNPFASQLLAASSKMFSNFDVNPFLQTTFKQVAGD